MLTVAHCQAGDIEPPPAEEAGHPGEHSRFVLHQGDYGVMAAIIVHLVNPQRDRLFQHFVNGLPGGDHREDMLIMFDDEVHHHRTRGLHSLMYGRRHLGFIGHPYAGDAVSLGNLHEIGVAAVDGGEKVLLVEEVLPLAHHAQSAHC